MEGFPIETFLDCIEQFTVIQENNFPEIELYIDQVTTYLDEKLKGYKRKDTDKALTKTMVNNYTKDKLLPVSNKKKYGTEHLRYLILIYHLKSSLSIEDISVFLDHCKETFDTPAQLYQCLTTVQEKQKSEFIQEITASGVEGNDNIMHLLLRLAVEIEMKKVFMEKLLDALPVEMTKAKKK